MKESLGYRIAHLPAHIPNIENQRVTERQIQISEIEESFTNLGRLSDYLDQNGFSQGVIELGANLFEVNWEAMPISIRKPFMQEVYSQDYQPVEFSSFRIVCSKKDTTYKTRNIAIELRRKNKLWSKISAEAEFGTSAKVSVEGKTLNRKQEAKDAFKAIGAWEKYESNFLHQQKKLRVLNDIISFAVHTLETSAC